MKLASPGKPAEKAVNHHGAGVSPEPFRQPATRHDQLPTRWHREWSSLSMLDYYWLPRRGWLLEGSVTRVCAGDHN
jgi:hypothetical protein